jgi:hypothetical protein
MGAQAKWPTSGVTIESLASFIFLPIIFLPLYLEIWKANGKKRMGKKIKHSLATND